MVSPLLKKIMTVKVIVMLLMIVQVYVVVMIFLVGVLTKNLLVHGLLFLNLTILTQNVGKMEVIL